MSIKNDYRVQSIDKKECTEWFLKKHYAKKIPNSIYTFGLYEGELLQGVISFGNPPNYKLNEIIQGVQSVELNRLVINENTKENALSFFVSQSLKMLPKPMVVVSYADSGQGHHGYIYQATNWLYTGLQEGDREFIKNGKQHHRKKVFDRIGSGSVEKAKNHGYQVVYVREKHRYIALLGSKSQKRAMLQKLPFKIQPYPKGDNQNYDASYKPNVQTTLL